MSCHGQKPGASTASRGAIAWTGNPELHDRLLRLSDEVEVWPGHLGGSLCGGPGMDLKVASTIGYERAHNELLRIADEDEFVARAIAGLPPQPPKTF